MGKLGRPSAARLEGREHDPFLSAAPPPVAMVKRLPADYPRVTPQCLRSARGPISSHIGSDSTEENEPTDEREPEGREHQSITQPPEFVRKHAQNRIYSTQAINWPPFEWR